MFVDWLMLVENYKNNEHDFTEDKTGKLDWTLFCFHST